VIGKAQLPHLKHLLTDIETSDAMQLMTWESSAQVVSALLSASSFSDPVW